MARKRTAPAPTADVPARPLVGYWEDDADGVPQFATRPATDAEYDAWLEGAEVVPPAPLLAQVEAMTDDERAQLRVALGVES